MALPEKKKVYIRTFGCQMNVYDSQRMTATLETLGYQLSDAPEGADLAILNTCHIREKAEQKTADDLGRLRIVREKTNPEMLIAVAGCVAQAQGDELLRRTPYVDMIFGPQAYHLLPEMLAQAARLKAQRQEKGLPTVVGQGKRARRAGLGILAVDFEAQDKFDQLPQVSDVGASAFLTIQEGCDKFCTFCVVPFTRGAEFSRPVQAIVDEAKQLVDRGAVELTLLGQNVNAYHGEGADGKLWTLGQLLHALAKIEGIQRLRYTTSHPRDVDQTLIEAHRDIPSVMPFLHLPVQSGSDRVLKAMNRKHGRDLYFKVIEDFRAHRPDIAFSSDFIVGFPGETEQDFEDTLDLIRQVNFAQAYSFKYSPRLGTGAATMPDQVSDAEKTDRLNTLQDLLRQQQVAFNTSFVGQTMPVLLDRRGRHAGQLLGRSPWMQSVHVDANSRLYGQIVDVKINASHLNSLTGSIVLKE